MGYRWCLPVLGGPRLVLTPKVSKRTLSEKTMYIADTKVPISANGYVTSFEIWAKFETILVLLVNLSSTAKEGEIPRLLVGKKVPCGAAAIFF